MIKKIFSLLNQNNYNKKFIYVLFIMVVGMFFELLSIGLFIPLIGILVSENGLNDYPIILESLDTFDISSKESIIISALLFLVFIYLVKGFLLIIIAWIQNKFLSNLSSIISIHLFKGYLLSPFSFYLEANSSELIRNIKDEIYQFIFSLQAVMLLVTEILLSVASLVLLIYVEPLGTIIVFSTFIVIGGSYLFIMKDKFFKWGEDRQNFEGRINSNMIEGFGGIKEIKLTGREFFYVKRFSDLTLAKNIITAKQLTAQQIPKFFIELFAIVGLVGLTITLFLSEKGISNSLPIIGVFMAAAIRLMPSINRIVNSLQVIRYSTSAIDLLFNELSNIGTIKTFNNLLINESFNDKIIMNDISFKYPNSTNYTISKLNLEIKKGDVIGIIGKSGAGKSTLINIILGLIDPTTGTIFVDGKNIKNNISNWQSQIGYVPQSVYVFDETLEKNIAFGVLDTDIDSEKVLESLNKAQLKDLESELKSNGNLKLGEIGSRISGGQKQRIGIARTLYQGSSVLIFDEATSSLDVDTEKDIMKVIYGFKRDKTILIISHKEEILKGCDKIYKLVDSQLILKTA